MKNQYTMEPSQDKLIIGYYPVRAKAQCIRLLCEFLHIPYVDLLLDPDQWELYKQTEAKNWIIKDLPFLIDGNFKVTGSAGGIYYVIQKSGRLDLLGRTLEDNVKITSLGNRKDLHNAILSLKASLREADPEVQQKKMTHYWTTKIEPAISSYQKEALEGDWYFGYLSLMDFVMYELVTQLQLNFPAHIKKFPKLLMLKARVYSLPEISNYENSPRAIRQFRPVNYFNKYKQEKRVRLANSTSSSFNSNQEMQPQY